MSGHDLSAAYWESRARRYAGSGRALKAVCSYGMPGMYNAAIDLCQRRALRPWLTAGAGKSVLDVGCGVGRWSLPLARRGLAVTGIDVSPFMILRASSRANAEALNCRFQTLDVRDFNLAERFDLILCVTVLQHIVDPAQAQRAIERLVSHMAPGARLILLEAAPTHATHRCDSEVFRARALEWYCSTLSTAGVSILAIRGVDPLPLKRWLLPRFQRMAPGLRWLTLAASAAISLPIDWLLASHLAGCSWHKVIVAQRVENGPERPALL
jgi:SAM-dependent methyltransferase